MKPPTEMPPTLYIASARPEDVPGSLTLDRGASQHIRALRLRDGAAIRITDGRGCMWSGHLEGAAGRPRCHLEASLEVEPLLPIQVAFGVGAKPRTLWLVEKAVELGARSLQPIELRRSASVADAARSAGFWNKARRRAEAALEQSGGAWLPDLRLPMGLTDYLADGFADSTYRTSRLVLLPSAGQELSELVSEWDGRWPMTLLVGAEGGFQDEEVRACERAGFRSVRLGNRTLRFETAAIAALAVVSQRAAARRRSYRK